MPHFVLLVGLPGSGKTHYGKSLGVRFLDDISQNGGLLALEKIENEALVISDHSFVFESDRQAAKTILKNKFPGCTLEWIFWENNPDQCWENVSQREDGRNISRETIAYFSKCYQLPKGVFARPVFKR